MHTFTCVSAGIKYLKNLSIVLEAKKEEGRKEGREGKAAGRRGRRRGKVGERDELSSQSYNTTIRSSSRTQIACVGVSVCGPFSHGNYTLQFS